MSTRKPLTHARQADTAKVHHYIEELVKDSRRYF